MDKSIIQLLLKGLDTDKTAEEIDVSEELDVIGVNSINFIKFIVEIENFYDIEFDDDSLDYKHFKTVDDLIKTVKEAISA